MAAGVKFTNGDAPGMELRRANKVRCDVAGDSCRVIDLAKLGSDLLREQGERAHDVAIDRATAAIVAGDEAEVERRIRVVEAIERELSARRKAVQRQ